MKTTKTVIFTNPEKKEELTEIERRFRELTKDWSHDQWVNESMKVQLEYSTESHEKIVRSFNYLMDYDSKKHFWEKRKKEAYMMLDQPPISKGSLEDELHKTIEALRKELGEQKQELDENIAMLKDRVRDFSRLSIIQQTTNMELREALKDVDDILSHQESFEHGKAGEAITTMRKRIEKLLNPTT